MTTSSKRLPIYLSFIRFGSSVYFHMWGKGATLAKCLTAYLTFIRFGSSVCFHMRGKPATLAKRLTAYLTFIRFGSSVYFHMWGKGTTLAKRLTAFLTLAQVCILIYEVKVQLRINNIVKELLRHEVGKSAVLDLYSTYSIDRLGKVPVRS